MLNLGNAEKFKRPVPELGQLEDSGRWKLFHLLEGGGGDFKKMQQLGQAVARVGRRGFGPARLIDAVAQNPHSRLDLPLLPFARYDTEHRENIFERLEVIAAISHNMDDSDDPPILEFTQARARVGTSHSERLGDLVGGEGFFRKKEQGVDLRDGAVNAPARPHLSPMEDEFLGDGGKVCHRTVFSDKTEIREIQA